MAEPSIILLVEDDAALRRLVAAWLRPSGYQVLEASCGADAIRAFAESNGRVSLLLTDINLADGISGNELADRLESISQELRVVVMSGSAETSTGFHGKRHFVSKPFTSADLLSKIEEASLAGAVDRKRSA